MSVSGTTSYEISGYMRVASLAIAAYDYFQTLPFELRMWKVQWRARGLTLSFALFILIRYISILTLTVSNVGFFYRDFTREGCLHYFLIPSVFKVLQAMVSQAILGVRAYNLSRKSAKIGGALFIIYLISCSLEWVTTLYRRQMVYNGNCASLSPHRRFGGWLHYVVAIIYDFTTSVFCIVLLLQLKTSSSGSMMARVTRMMLVDGLWYFVALTLVNVLNLAFYRTSPMADEVQTAAASLGYCVTWIMSQKLLVHLHNASVERRNESIGAAVTITQHISSARDASRVMRSQFESKNGLELNLTVPDFDFDSIQSGSAMPDDMDVQVRVERTVRMERLPRVYELEDYSRNTRSTRYSKH
ncbi:hypothetical protein B0H17DRAFT_1064332 [Mycena rosella]|uniref:DUF6533 domain-containing protein n=1 Tax=Mycena rosella TaxID=1033263 RepID=A0AAD7DIW8_MYCRO|nr:hypothetical protein B0H17DRAFT_1064332 [Mycena rosella]